MYKTVLLLCLALGACAYTEERDIEASLLDRIQNVEARLEGVDARVDALPQEPGVSRDEFAHLERGLERVSGALGGHADQSAERAQKLQQSLAELRRKLDAAVSNTNQLARRTATTEKLARQAASQTAVARADQGQRSLYRQLLAREAKRRGTVDRRIAELAMQLSKSRAQIEALGKRLPKTAPHPATFRRSPARAASATGGRKPPQGVAPSKGTPQEVEIHIDNRDGDVILKFGQGSQPRIELRDHKTGRVRRVRPKQAPFVPGRFWNGPRTFPSPHTTEVKPRPHKRPRSRPTRRRRVRRISL